MNAKANIMQAAEKIAEILAQLETDTGDQVDSIDLRSVEVTTMNDKLRRERTHVVITMRAPAIREWK